MTTTALKIVHFAESFVNKVEFCRIDYFVNLVYFENVFNMALLYNPSTLFVNRDFPQNPTLKYSNMQRSTVLRKFFGYCETILH